MAQRQGQPCPGPQCQVEKMMSSWGCSPLITPRAVNGASLFKRWPSKLEAAAKREDDRETTLRQQHLRAQLSDKASGLQRACHFLRQFQAAAISTLKANDGTFTCDPF